MITTLASTPDAVAIDVITGDIFATTFKAAISPGAKQTFKQ